MIHSNDTNFSTTISKRLKLFFTFNDSRYEDINKKNWLKTTYKDLSAGLVVAMTAIPMAMGFAIAMGMRPEHGIIAGAIACLVGRTFGGSKYQVYGPTAAFIPIIASLIAKYSDASIGGSFEQAHGFLVLVSIIAGIILMILGIFGIGKFAKIIPNSIIVGFTVGIAVTIALTNFEDILGIESFRDLINLDDGIENGLIANLKYVFTNINFELINFWAVFLGLLTFFLTKILLRISIFIPGPIIAIATATILSSTLLSDKNIILVRDL